LCLQSADDPMAMNRNCVVCGYSLPSPHRKYCSSIRPRRACSGGQARKAHAGEPYYLDWWLKATGSIDAARSAYNDYVREYMRR
jgi:hypothetical protein